MQDLISDGSSEAYSSLSEAMLENEEQGAEQTGSPQGGRRDNGNGSDPGRLDSYSSDGEVIACLVTMSCWVSAAEVTLCCLHAAS